MTDKKPRKPLTDEQRAKRAERSKAWREAHPDYMKKYMKKYRPEHLEEMLEAGRAYHAANKDERNARRRQWSIENKEKEKAGRKAWYQANKSGKFLDTFLRSKYGITLEDYGRLLINQGGGCAICHRSDAGVSDGRRLHVDHDHQTGRVRGLLCHSCNSLLGHARDQQDILRGAVRYLSLPQEPDLESFDPSI